MTTTDDLEALALGDDELRGVLSLLGAVADRAGSDLAACRDLAELARAVGHALPVVLPASALSTVLPWYPEPRPLALDCLSAIGAVAERAGDDPDRLVVVPEVTRALRDLCRPDRPSSSMSAL